MRRHLSHYLGPARANARQGKTSKPAATAPSHHSNAPIKPESQSILRKIVAHWLDGLPPDPGRASLLLSGHWLNAARHLSARRPCDAADYFARGARQGAPPDRRSATCRQLASRRFVPCRECRLFACRIPDAHSVAAEAPWSRRAVCCLLRRSPNYQ